MAANYDKGLTEVADGVWAYLQPDGGWGWSNAGLVASGGEALLVDTLFDARLTAEMLATMRATVPAAGHIDIVVNTHANGDHWFGNSVVTGAQIIASSAAAAEMVELPPSRMAGMMEMAPELGEVGKFMQRIFGPFDFDGIEAKLPDQTFDGRLELSVDGHTVELIEVGPAHTEGDVVVHLPAEGVVFTGDILFHGGHPIVWAGPVANWIAACDRVIGLGAETIVPGHGPIATPAAVADLKGYFELLTEQAREHFEGGVSAGDAARDIDLGPYSGWREGERLIVNIHALYRDFGADVSSDAASLLGAMASFGDDQ